MATVISSRLISTVFWRFMVMAALLVAWGMHPAEANPGSIPFPGGVNPIKKPIIKPVGRIVIRGIPYNDHSVNTSLAPKVSPPGGWIEITTTSLWFERLSSAPGYQLKVVIQDTQAPSSSSGGVTVFELRNRFARGTLLQAQLPFEAVFHRRSFYVTVFAWGPQGNHYAHAGVVRIEP